MKVTCRRDESRYKEVTVTDLVRTHLVRQGVYRIAIGHTKG